MAEARIRLQRIGNKGARPRDPVRFYILPALNEESALQKVAFSTISDGWENNKITVSKRGARIIGGKGVVDTGALADTQGNRILSWINYGTGPRTIHARPDNPRGMRFMRGYSPSTRPGTLHSGRKQRHLPWTRRMVVRGHTIKAREFDELIAENRQKKFPEIFKIWMTKYASQFWIKGK